ncbi:hypothetical protein [Anaplasma capra]|uniref:hypothetical protein n=1 Tax=Anaplasma capra TaxID=1562740 RepID=UPI0021D5F572|nr:hypothetical protein [Anaplasma capra]MCU7611957.1 hypothetical protein [Anaplasma capra]
MTEHSNDAAAANDNAQHTISQGAATTPQGRGATANHKDANDAYSKGIPQLEQYIEQHQNLDTTEVLGFGTSSCLLEKAVKDGNVRAVELLSRNFSDSVLQRTLHLNADGKSLLDQAIDCHFDKDPAVALEIVKKLCGTFAAGVADDALSAAKDIIESLHSKAVAKGASDISAYCTDTLKVGDTSNWLRYPISVTSASEEYRNRAQSAFDAAKELSDSAQQGKSSNNPATVIANDKDALTSAYTSGGINGLRQKINSFIAEGKNTSDVRIALGNTSSGVISEVTKSMDREAASFLSTLCNNVVVQEFRNAGLIEDSKSAASKDSESVDAAGTSGQENDLVAQQPANENEEVALATQDEGAARGDEPHSTDGLAGDMGTQGSPGTIETRSSGDSEVEGSEQEAQIHSSDEEEALDTEGESETQDEREQLANEVSIDNAAEADKDSEPEPHDANHNKKAPAAKRNKAKHQQKAHLARTLHRSHGHHDDAEQELHADTAPKGEKSSEQQAGGISNLTQYATSIADRTKEAMSGLAGHVGTAGNKITTALEHLKTVVETAAREVRGAVRLGVTELRIRIWDALYGLFVAIRDFLENLGSKIKAQFKSQVDRLAGIRDSIKDSLPSVDVIKNDLLNSKHNLLEFAALAEFHVRSTIDGMLLSAQGAGREVGTRLSDTARTAQRRVSSALSSLKTSIESARSYMAAQKDRAVAVPAHMLENIKGRLQELVSAVAHLLNNLGSAVKARYDTQVAKLATIRDIFPQVVRPAPSEAQDTQAGVDGLATPTATKQQTEVPAHTAEHGASAPTELCSGILEAATQGKLPSALEQRSEALTNPETLYAVLSHKNEQSLGALDLCVRSENVRDLISTVRIVKSLNNRALNSVLACHLVKSGGQSGKSIIQEIMDIAANNSNQLSDVKELVTELVGGLCYSLGSVEKRLLAGHVASAALQSGVIDILDQAMSAAPIAEEGLTQNPTLDTIAQGIMTWIENAKADVQESKVHTGVLLLKKFNKIANDTAQEMAARCSSDTIAELVYRVACEHDIIKAEAADNTAVPAYAARYELSRAMSVLRSEYAKCAQASAAYSKHAPESGLTANLAGIFKSVGELTGRQLADVATQLVTDTRNLTDSIQRISSNPATGNALTEIEDVVASYTVGISALIGSAKLSNPQESQSAFHKPVPLAQEGGGHSRQASLLAMALKQLHNAADHAYSSYSGPFRDASIESLTNSLVSAEEDIASAVKTLTDSGAPGVTVDLKNATRRMACAISENAHVVFCSPKILEEMLHAATLLGMAAGHTRSNEEQLDTVKDSTYNELITSFEEKTADACYHLTSALNSIEKHIESGSQGTHQQDIGSKLRAAMSTIKRGSSLISQNVPPAPQVETLLTRAKNELSQLTGDAPLHLRAAASSVVEHIVRAIECLGQAIQRLRDVCVHLARKSLGNIDAVYNLGSPERNPLSTIPAIRTRIRETETALSRSELSDADKLKEALSSADSVLAEIYNSLPSRKQGFLDGNAPQSPLHECVRQISQYDQIVTTPPLNSKIQGVITDLEGVVSKLADIKTLNTLNESPAVEIPETFARNSLQALAHMLRVRSALAGVRASVTSGQLEEIASTLLPVSNGRFMITSGADLAVVLKKVIEEHHTTHSKNTVSRAAPIAILSEIAEEVVGSTHHVASIVPVQFVYNTLAACSSAMQLSAAADGIRAEVSKDTLNKIMIAGLPRDVRNSRMISDPGVIASIMDNFVQQYRDSMYRDAVHAAKHSLDRSCVDLIKQLVNRGSEFSLSKEVPESIYSVEPRAELLEATLGQALSKALSGDAQVGTKASDGSTDLGSNDTVILKRDIARAVLTASMCALQDVIITGRKGRMEGEPSVPSNIIGALVDDAAWRNADDDNDVWLNRKIISEVLVDLRERMKDLGVLTNNEQIRTSMVERFVGTVLRSAVMYKRSSGNQAEVAHDNAEQQIEGEVVRAYVADVREKCRDEASTALQNIKNNIGDEHAARICAKAVEITTALMHDERGQAHSNVPDCIYTALAMNVATDISGALGATQQNMGSLLKVGANFSKNGIVNISQEFFTAFFKEIRNIAEGYTVGEYAAFGSLTDNMIEHLARDTFTIYNAASSVWRDGVVTRVCNTASVIRDKQYHAITQNSVDQVPHDLARKVLAASMEAVSESVGIMQGNAEVHCTREQIDNIVSSALSGDGSSSATKGNQTITHTLILNMLTELNSVMLSRIPAHGADASNQVPLVPIESRSPIARMALSTIRECIRTSDDVALQGALLEHMQRSIHRACGTDVVVEPMEAHARPGRSELNQAPELVLNLATVLTGLTDARDEMSGIADNNNLYAAQKQRISSAIRETEDLITDISTSGVRVASSRVKEAIGSIIGALERMSSESNLTLRDSYAISVACASLVTQLGLVEASLTGNSRVVFETSDTRGAAPRMVEAAATLDDPVYKDAGPVIEDALSASSSGFMEDLPGQTNAATNQQTPLSPNERSNVEIITRLGRTARLLEGINEFLLSQGDNIDANQVRLMSNLARAKTHLESAQNAALDLALCQITNAEESQQQNTKNQLVDHVQKCQKCLSDTMLAGAQLSEHVVRMLSGAHRSAALVSHTLQPTITNEQGWRIVSQDLKAQISRMISLSRSAAHSENAVSNAPESRLQEYKKSVLISLSEAENMAKFLDEGCVHEWDSPLITAISQKLTNCQNFLTSFAAAHGAEGAEQPSIHLQIAANTVRMALDLISSIPGQEGASLHQGSSGPSWRDAALIDVYEAALSADALVSAVYVDTEDSGLVLKKGAAQILCELDSQQASHEQVQDALDGLGTYVLGARTLLHKICGQLANDGQYVPDEEHIRSITGGYSGTVAAILPEVVHSLDKISKLTKSAAHKASTTAECQNVLEAVAIHHDAASTAQQQRMSSPTAEQWLRMIIVGPSATPSVPEQGSASQQQPYSDWAQKIKDVSQKLEGAASLLYGYTLGAELSATNSKMTKALGNAANLLPLIEGVGGGSMTDGLCANTVSLAFRLEGRNIPQDNVGKIVAKFGCIASKLALLTSLRDLEGMVSEFEAMGESEQKVADAVRDFKESVDNMKSLSEEVVNKIDQLVSLQSLTSGTHGLIVEQELGKVAVSTLTGDYEKGKKLDESIRSVRKVLGERFIIADHTLLQNMFNIQDKDSAETYCGSAVLLPTRNCIERVMSTISGALRSDLIDSERALNLLTNVLKNSEIANTVHVNDRQMYGLREADITDILMAFYTRDGRDGIEFLRDKCDSYTINASRIEGAILAKLCNNAPLDLVDPPLLDLCKNDIFTDHDEAARKCKNVEANFLRTYLDRKFGAEHDATGHKPRHYMFTPSHPDKYPWYKRLWETIKVLVSMRPAAPDKGPWYKRALQYVVDFIKYFYAATMLLVVRCVRPNTSTEKQVVQEQHASHMEKGRDTAGKEASASVDAERQSNIAHSPSSSAQSGSKSDGNQQELRPSTTFDNPEVSQHGAGQRRGSVDK